MDNLKENTPELSKIKKENPFRVPENYFDDFSARLQMKIEAEKKVVPAPKKSIIQLLKPAISLAASFALIFLLVYWPLKSFLPNKLAESNTIEIESYDNENQYLTLLEGIDENSFYALLDEPTAKVEFSDDELINYINTNISEYDIYLGTDN
ncbi:hypothetical protein GM418_17680 [Maribellus comscasis]|uniref:Uncharacterized protein n=1 Tax=Maribellus comscasis TaxID=2681766 RepID=A0A6I6JR55_9BACT|nr:hypothetical protein [Maribellus comscasis]QGY45436.1 hypothetical protein GM418_17680 [Maribellus comscasis]